MWAMCAHASSMAESTANDQLTHVHHYLASNVLRRRPLHLEVCPTITCLG